MPDLKLTKRTEVVSSLASERASSAGIGSSVSSAGQFPFVGANLILHTTGNHQHHHQQYQHEHRDQNPQIASRQHKATGCADGAAGALEATAAPSNTSTATDVDGREPLECGGSRLAA